MQTFPILRTIYEELAKYGNLTSPCPILPGYYYMKDVEIDDVKYANVLTAMPDGKYVMHADVTDENSKKPISIVGLDVYCTFKKNKNYK
jgi:hypothetical protein